MKQIKTTTVKMTADVEVLPVTSQLVARIVRASVMFKNTIFDCDGDVYDCPMDEVRAKTLEDVDRLLTEIVMAFTGETDNEQKIPIGEDTTFG